jgi:hypothetical protein
MVTRRKWLEFWTETKRVVKGPDGEPFVKQVRCCCADPAGTRQSCRDASGNKTPCRCFCHSLDWNPVVKQRPRTEGAK